MKTSRVCPFALSKYYELSTEAQLGDIAKSVFQYLVEETSIFTVDPQSVNFIALARYLNNAQGGGMNESHSDYKLKQDVDFVNVSYVDALNEYSLILYSSTVPKCCILTFKHKSLLFFASPLKYKQYFCLDLNKSKLFTTNNLIYGFSSTLDKYYGKTIKKFYVVKQIKKKKKRIKLE